MSHSRIFTVPIDSHALEALDRDEALPNQLIERSITSDEFDFLFKSGLLETINHECNCNIGDYESEELTSSDSLERVRKILLRETKREQKLLIDDLLRLTNEAIKRGTGLYIFF